MSKQSTRLITFGSLTADVSEIRSCRVVTLEDGASFVHVEHGSGQARETVRFDDAESAEAARASFCQEWRGIVSPPAPVNTRRMEHVVIVFTMATCVVLGWVMHPVIDVLLSMREPVTPIGSTSGELGYPLTGGTSR